MVATPADPEDTLADTETKGVGVAEVALGLLEPDEPPVSDAELPLPDPVPLARPVMPERVGTEDASLEPTVAYAVPSRRAKNGRGAGDSWQQSTCTASALQHQLLS